MSVKGIERPYGVDLPEGIKHLHGSMYLVRFDLLCLPDPETIRTAAGLHKRYEFRNPRSLTQNGQAVLFDKKKSEEMRESIKDKTLMTAFVGRWQKDGDDHLLVQMVGGERRHRAIHWLGNKKEMVKDARSAKLNKDTMEYEYDYNPADQVYEHVLCVIFAVNNDIDALALAYTDNDCRVNQGSGHDIAMTIELRQCQATDEQIMEAMSKDEKWLRDTDNLITNLYDKTLLDLIEDRIDREACLELLDIRENYGEEVAAKALAVAHETAERDYKKKFERLTKKVMDARDDQEIAEGSVAEAEFQNEGESEAKATLGEAKAKVNRTIKERSKEHKTTERDHIKSGLKVVTDQSPKTSVLRSAKIKQYYLEPLQDLCERDGKDIDGQYQADTDAIKLAIKLVKGIADGDTEGMEIIKYHYKK